MKLISLLVENFRGIRKAELEFGPGLNVLYGPNDLGKSSLAAAIRAALLLQSTSREHEEFISWHGDGDPVVKLVFESEPQRIWRVRKTFGSGGHAFLDESRDGVDFHTVTKGREVDGQLSEILQWGLAPPGGGKGRPKGMPMTFLSTALLAEQDRVAAIFEQALSDDSDESGKKRLIVALQAVAEEPLYKRVLDKVQARVDEAFTSTGRRKGGKDSPWMRNREAIQRKEEDLRQCNEQLQRTASIETEMRDLREKQLHGKGSVAHAEGLLGQIETAHRQGQQRGEILARLELHQQALAELTETLRLLAEAEAQQRKGRLEVERLAKQELAARKTLDEATGRAQLAKDELLRLQSEDRVRERLLQRETIEKSCAELRTRQVQSEASLALVERVRRAAQRVSELDAEAAKLEAAVSASQSRHEEALKAVEEARRDERDLQAIGHWLQCVAARSKVAEAAAGLAQVEAWRVEARRLRAAALEAGPGLELLTSAQLQALERLDREVEVARAGLRVGLEVSVRARGKLRVSVSGDDGAWVAHDLDGSLLETAAHREIAIAFENIAEIVVSGGSAEARRTAAGLQARWAAEVEPVLLRAGAVNVAGLAKKMEESAERVRRSKEASTEAGQLEQRAADQPDWAGLHHQRQADLAAAAELVRGFDEAALENLARNQHISTAAESAKRLATRQVEVAQRTTTERKLSDELARVVAARQANQDALGSARAEWDQARPAIAGDWETVLRQCRADRESIDIQMKKAQAQLTALSSSDEESVLEARKLLDKAEARRAEAEAAQERAQNDLRKAENSAATIEGQLMLRKEAAAKCDEAGARAAVAQVQAELKLAPPPQFAIKDEDLALARLQLDEARAALERIEDEIHAKRGALQHVGGDVAKQHAADAQEALRAEREREQNIQNEYAALELLRKTLLEAEREEGVHLGRALGSPIAKRFGELTQGKYGEMNLGPNLDTPSIAAAGAPRDLRALSVGTREQLSTIFRLTLAEYLHSAVMLDDQLTQTDIHRMAWLRDLIREVTGNIQVIVFTCRPSDYLLPEEMQGAAIGAAVRSIDLAQAIDRTHLRMRSKFE